MPSLEHEMPTELLRNRPELIESLLRDSVGLELPAHARVTAEGGDLNDVVPTEYRADSVVMFTRSGSGEGSDDQRNVLAVAVEVQRDWKESKLWSWPVYVTTLRARKKCDAVLLVICPDEKTAELCAQSIPIGHPGFTLGPLVIGPSGLPLINEHQTTEAPELAVLSAIAHGADLGVGSQVLTAFVDTIYTANSQKTTDSGTLRLYADYVLMVLPELARKNLECIMTTATDKYKSDLLGGLFAEGEAKGEAKGEARAILTVLESRGVTITEETRQRIESCADVQQLDTWLGRAVNAATIDDLFA